MNYLEDKWVPIGDKYPPFGQDILLAIQENDGSLCLQPYVYQLEEDGTFTSLSGYMIRESQTITHWFLIPKTPSL